MEVMVGSPRWLASQGVPDVEHIAGPTVGVGIARNGRLIGGIELTDHARGDAALAVQHLQRLIGPDIWLLSGDATASTGALAASVGIDRWRAGLLPADKVAAVEQLQAARRTVLMMGDGVNDGPALATADVGMAMGGGTDVAFEAADAALMRPNLLLVPYAIALGRATVTVIRTNVAIALILKLLVILLAATGMASLWLAVAADVGASLLVVAISLRLLRFSTDEMAPS
jgi:Cd2+/Zn2+-exporting ATPase